MNQFISPIRLVVSVAVVLLTARLTAAAPVDVLTFADVESEAAHNLVAEKSDVINGGLDIPARRLLPGGQHDWEGGRVGFTMKVDPAKQNYFTIRLWGSEVNHNRLILFCEGKQIGYRHLGDVEILDFGTKEPAYAGRFYYGTNPLPVEMTRGKRALKFEIRSTGPIWAYGGPFDKYQKPMEGPARGMYRVYTHTDGYFTPPADERQGAAPGVPPVRKTPGPEVLHEVKARVNDAIAKILTDKDPPGQMQMQFLARAYSVGWTKAHQNPRVIERVVEGLDAVYAKYRADREFAWNDPSTWNPDWFGVGPSGQSIMLLAKPLAASFDQPDKGFPQLKRREAWTEMLIVSREWNRRNRRLYTNQTMIKDLFGIYLCNRGVAVLDPAKAMPEEQARRYLYESVGLQPWLGSDTDPSPDREDTDRPSRNWGVTKDYVQLTAKGLTKELGYVGSYGEVLDWVGQIYDATRPGPGQPGDSKIRDQFVKIALARAPFRRPALDEDGNRAMRLESAIGWRDTAFPGIVVYGQKESRDASSLNAAAATLDPRLVGYAQQSFADNQFFATVRTKMGENMFRVTSGLLETPDEYERIKAQPSSPHKLPMTPGQGDFVFTDEEAGVVAIKHGDEVLYASLYWRARNAINFLARVHYTTPTLDRVAVVRQDVKFEPSGLTYTRPDHIDFGFAKGGHDYPGELHSAHAGEKLPIAKIPAGVEFKPGDESVYAGKGSFYTLWYGPYLIGMNCSEKGRYTLRVPAGVTEALELVSRKTISSDADGIVVPPWSTVILYIAESAPAAATRTPSPPYSGVAAQQQ